MVEATPGIPYAGDAGDLLLVEANMAARWVFCVMPWVGVGMIRRGVGVGRLAVAHPLESPEFAGAAASSLLVTLMLFPSPLSRIL
jgi:hypothetical protein